MSTTKFRDLSNAVAVVSADGILLVPGGTGGAGADQLLTYSVLVAALEADLSISASSLTSGTIPDGRFPASLPAADGNKLINLDPTHISSGSINLGGGGITAGSGAFTVDAASGNVAGPSFTGSGANLTSLDAGNLATGEVAIARIPTGATSGTVCIGNDARLSDARTPVGTALASGRIWVGDNSAFAAPVITSGDVVLGTDGALTIQANSVTLGKIGSGAVTEANRALANNTTADVSTSLHGFAPKAPNDATRYLDGIGTYSIPAANLDASNLASGTVPTARLAAILGGIITAGAQPANDALTDSTGGTASTTMKAIVDPLGTLGSLVTNVNDNFASLTAENAKIRALLLALGIGT